MKWLHFVFVPEKTIILYLGIFSKNSTVMNSPKYEFPSGSEENTRKVVTDKIQKMALM
jgi:hypothetical protein